mmetsp:Transcript_2134/g.5965  ORF Transcript_2134/g.5965 Transcript_2134/m.5965 type:complete len:193 (+) Transcript_2134:804-1382(+)
MGRVLLDGLVGELSSNESLGVVDRVRRVLGRLVFGGVADQPRTVFAEGDVGRRDAVPLVVRADLDAAVAPDADATVRRAQVDADAGALDRLLRRAAAEASHGRRGAQAARREPRGGRREECAQERTAPPPNHGVLCARLRAGELAAATVQSCLACLLPQRLIALNCKRFLGIDACLEAVDLAILSHKRAAQH